MVWEIRGGWAITPRGVERDVSLAIEKDRIIDLGKTAPMRRKYKFSKSMGGDGTLLSPTFTDAHLHSFQIATRGLTCGRSLMAWLRKYIWRWEAEMTREQALACSRLCYLEMLRTGTTAFVDYTSVRHTGQAFRAAAEFGMRGCIGKTVMDRNSPPCLQEGTDEALKESEKLIRRHHNTENGRLRSMLIPRFTITCSDDLLRGCAGLSEKYGVMMTTHAHESRAEMEADRRITGRSAIAHLSKLGLLGPGMLLVHCVWLSPREMQLLAKSRTAVAHCPGSNMMLASGMADTPALLKSRIRVALGSDMGAYYRMGMFEQMRLASLMQKARTLDAGSLDHRAAFAMATSGGARALGLECGSLKPGMKADVLLLDARSSQLSPPNDMLAQLVYSASPSCVRSVVCDGKVLVEDGKIRVADEAAVISKAAEVLHMSSS